MPPKKRRGGGSGNNNDGGRPSNHNPRHTNLGQQSEDFNRNRQGGQGDGYGGRGRGKRKSGPSGPNGRRSGRGSFDDNANPQSPSLEAPPPSGNQMSPPPVTPTFQNGPSNQQPPAPRAAPQVTTEPPMPDVPYDWEYMDTSCTSVWKETGRQSVVDAGTNALEAKDSVTLSSIFQELIQAALVRRVEPTEAGTVVKDIIGSVEKDALDSSTIGSFGGMDSSDPSTIFLDVVSMLAEADASQPHPYLKVVLSATEIPISQIRQQLESPLLVRLGLIRDTFEKMGIRQSTNLLYRQSKYNLLREESEGYAKLITELFTQASQEPTGDNVEDTSLRVKALVGAFNLDVGRVLDVTLDAFANLLIKNYRFFVKFMRSSAWWPETASNLSTTLNAQVGTLPKWALPGSSYYMATDEDKEELSALKEQRDIEFWKRAKDMGLSAFFELCGRQPTSAEGEAELKRNAKDPKEAEDDANWIKITGTLPPSGNRVAAQLLGFKLRYYTTIGRDEHIAENLFFLAALLIKIGFISLRDLYPHVWPEDEDMAAVKVQKEAERVEKERENRPGGGSKNALLTAGALTMTDSHGNPIQEPRQRPPPKQDPATEKKADAPAAAAKEAEIKDQKIELLKNLLCIGALPDVLFMFGRLSWIPDLYPDVLKLFHTLLHHSLSKQMAILEPLPDRPSMQEGKRRPAADQQPGVVKGDLRLVSSPPRKPKRWAYPDKDNVGDNGMGGSDYRMYWEEWNDNVPVCQSVEDVFVLCNTLVGFSGFRIGRDPALLMKLVTIGIRSLKDDPSQSNLSRWGELTKRLLLPALSLAKAHPGAAEALWTLIERHPLSVRYNMYAEWYMGQTSRNPTLEAAFQYARLDARMLLKRMNADNFDRVMTKAFTVSLTSSPGIVLQEVFKNIEAYGGNTKELVKMTVHVLRQGSKLSHDMLPWCLMNSLYGQGRNKSKADGMFTSQWLLALASFTGTVFQRMTWVSPVPILQYITSQLQRGSSTDLVVLKQIIIDMAGIAPDPSLNESQIQGLAGGKLLIRDTLVGLMDKRHECERPAQRLIHNLITAKLVGKLLILIAQERQTCVFKVDDDDAHVKLLGNLFDETHGVLQQYLSFLRETLPAAKFDAFVPNVADLIKDFGIDPSVAWWISRPSITEKMRVAVEAIKSPSPPVDAAGDTEMVEAKVEEVITNGNGVKSTTETTVEDVDMTDGTAIVVLKTPSSPYTQTNGTKEPYPPAIKTLSELIQPALPEEVATVISVPFYVTFWQLSLHDLLVPSKNYIDITSLVNRQIQAINSDRSIKPDDKLERKKILQSKADDMTTELKKHINDFSSCQKRLGAEKDYWLADRFGDGGRVHWDVLSDAIIQHCIFPRMILTPSDATFCWRFIKLVHSAGAVNFRTLLVIDRMLDDKKLAAWMFAFTSREAENFAIFLNDMLKELRTWHKDESVFEKEAWGKKKDLPGFAVKLTSPKDIATFMDWQTYRRILHKWHVKISQALKVCLTGGEYMHMKNAMLVLKGISQHYPVLNFIGDALVKNVTAIGKEETRDDLRLMANALLGPIKRNEKDWVPVAAFCENLVCLFPIYFCS
jgi:THO complex subunit 2